MPKAVETTHIMVKIRIGVCTGVFITNDLSFIIAVLANHEKNIMTRRISSYLKTISRLFERTPKLISGESNIEKISKNKLALGERKANMEIKIATKPIMII